ncbi:hypothetical protein [Marinobacterium stanieri]|uniref:Uncharacterized protein n=1 Tax=Marinobacterium stanieri TaxID=49186 RepID=A0A1N6QBV2_9GAMM|nr:hypothetical protein [Marinobacterium stanieri]SIQ14035.1 hypothetical protein SAMN05421647_102403 [Marinobacterium stanieri]
MKIATRSYQTQATTDTVKKYSGFLENARKQSYSLAMLVAVTAIDSKPRNRGAFLCLFCSEIPHRCSLAVAPQKDRSIP